MEQSQEFYYVSVPLNTGYSSPTQAGGLYDVRDSEGDKAIAHLDWTLGAGQKTLDREGATSSKFWKSQSIDISRPGELRPSRVPWPTCTRRTWPGPGYSALGKIWVGDSLGGLKYSADNGATWTDCDGYTSTRPITCFASDGTRLYIGFAAGTSYGIYVNSAGDLNTFAKFPSTGTGPTEAIRHLAYCSGYLLTASSRPRGTGASGSRNTAGT